MAILKFIGIFLEVLLIFNLLIIVHELGHFLAAKWRGLYIERFGVWFGKPIWEKKIGGVWYSLGCIPAGGFVKLPQLAPMEALEGQTEIPKEQLKDISALDKIIVAFAGPLFSFMLAIAFAFLVWGVGRPMSEQESTQTIGSVEINSPADKAGLKVGDKIVAIDDVPVARFSGQGSDSIMWRIVRSEGETIKVEVERDGKKLVFNPKPELPDKAFYERAGTRYIGIRPSLTPLVGKVEAGSPAEKMGLQKGDFITEINGQKLFSEGGIPVFVADHPGANFTLTVERGLGANQKTLQIPYQPRPPIVSSVQPDSPAERAGLKAKDRIVKLNDQPVFSYVAVTNHIKQADEKPITLLVERDGKELPPITVTPKESADEKRLMIGASFEDDLGIVQDAYGRGKTVHPTPAEQIETSAGAIASTLGAVTSRKTNIGVQHLGGPVMMMNIYYRLFEQEDGWKLALWFSVFLNVNLAIINLLPLPVLDGGHITLAIIEAIRRKPANIKVLEWIQTACALLIIGFLLMVTFYDVQDVFGGGGSNKFHYANPSENK